MDFIDKYYYFSVPHLDYLWDFYYRLPIHFVASQWHFKTSIMRGNAVGIERTRAWYHVIVLTELLRMRGRWDKEKKQPIRK